MKQLNHPKLYSRQKLLLAIIQKFGRTVASIDLQKYLFLFTNICQKKPSYEFVPYRFGCFSFQSYTDRRKLVDFGILESDEKWALTEHQADYVDMLDVGEQKKLNLFFEKYEGLHGNKLVQEVYRHFPYYATRSEIAADLMSESELEKIDAVRPRQVEKSFFTIGYEGQSFENYLNRLIENNIQLLCDVRKNPLSRKYGFSKRTLSDTLEKLDIQYIHMPALGIVSDKRQELNSQADYDRLFNEYERSTLKDNSDAIDTLIEFVEQKRRVAITCFEATHCMCHRGRVAKAVAKHAKCDFPIQHI